MKVNCNWELRAKISIFCASWFSLTYYITETDMKAEHTHISLLLLFTQLWSLGSSMICRAQAGGQGGRVQSPEYPKLEGTNSYLWKQGRQGKGYVGMPAVTRRANSPFLNLFAPLSLNINEKFSEKPFMDTRIMA